MFYCNECARARDWPQSSSRWRGLCEVCGKFDDNMSDVPSRALPERNTAALSEGQEGK